MGSTIPDDFRIAVAHAADYLAQLAADHELTIPDCDEHGECRGCAEEANVEWIVQELRKGLAKEAK